MLASRRSAPGGFRALVASELRARVRLFSGYVVPGLRPGRPARFRAVVLMPGHCRWLRSDVVGTYCSMCGLIVTPGQRCIARPPVRVESCFGDHDMTCRTCALASTDECPAHDFEAWAFPDCPFWTPRAPLPSRPDVPEFRQMHFPGFE